jgi:hypothetical protein
MGPAFAAVLWPAPLAASKNLTMPGPRDPLLNAAALSKMDTLCRCGANDMDRRDDFPGRNLCATAQWVKTRLQAEFAIGEWI